jgi:methyltransferase-like protein/SAM-dependent methyltransferase
MTAVTNTYDAIPYTTRPRRATHPDTLAAAAVLTGMRPAPLDRCRVLELGCGTGGNLVPMAATLPGGRFVGVDLSAVQIADADRTARALGLANVEFRAASILDVDDSWGAFDYVICHGVYSWVPTEVQDKILDVCARNLAPQGVAYVSYNTYPGWHLRSVARDAMQFHARRASTPAEQVATARGYLSFLARSAPEQDELYARLLKGEVELIAEQHDYYLFHEHLESDNRPLYFREFADRAAAHGLQYLGEVPPHRLLLGLPPETQKTLRQISPDLIELEQNVDFLRNKAFRRTLLCRADVPLDRAPGPEVFDRFLASALARPTAADPDVASNAPVEFVAQNGTQMSTSDPVIKAALVALLEAWPRPVPVPDLTAAVAGRLGPVWSADPTRGRLTIAQTLLDFYLAGLVTLHTHAPPFAVEPSDRPVGFPPARLQAADRDLVCTATHQEATVPPLERFVLRQLDGTRDRAAVAAAVADAVRAGEVPPPDGPPGRWADDALARLGRAALLIG